MEVIDRHEGVPVIAPTDCIDINNSNELRDVILAEFENGATALILDFVDVHYIDSSGLSALVGAANVFERKGGQLVICGMDPGVQRILELTRLNEFFFVASDRASATTLLESLAKDSSST